MERLEELCESLGEARLRGVVAAFYRRVPDDSILGAMYPADDLAGAEARLADFLVYRFGGSQAYIQERGHPRLRRRHMPFAVDAAARDRWLELIGEALDEGSVVGPARALVDGFFAHTADFLRNRP